MLNQMIAALGIPRVESEPKGLGITRHREARLNAPGAERLRVHDLIGRRGNSHANGL